MSTLLTDKTQFRDHISTADESGKRIWLHPQKPNGRFYNYRKIVSYVLLLLFFGLPFLKYDGEPLFLFNLLERRFIFFGMVFLPQDFPLMGIAMLTFIVFIVLFTAVYGRAFCGWVCPQTIFMEMVFRRIEYWIDGDANEQKRLKNSAWDTTKTTKRVSKYSLFFLISFLISNLFFAYLIGVDALEKIITEPISQHLGLFMGLIFFSFVFFFVFTYVRENVCILICPYGRLQGVLLDKKSISVAYDYLRGEPRGKLKKEKKVAQSIDNQLFSHISPDQIKEEVAQLKTACSCVGCDNIGKCKDKKPIENIAPSLGDCIDCGLCVKVCPTGIDIRNGVQLECINCTACMDACDTVMDKIGKPKGLIRYASEENIQTGKKLVWTARITAYSAVLGILLITFLALILNRSQVDATIFRTPGMTYQILADSSVSNLYNIKILNKSHSDLNFDLNIENQPSAKIQLLGNHALNAMKSDYAVGEFFIIFPENTLQKRNSKIAIAIYANGKKQKTIETNFIAPQ
jgi:polyferredoxin